MITVRKAEDRGKADFGWLKSRHTFSFGSYHDPDHMGFGPLRVINDDRVAPGGGFPPHGHRDMEIISYVLDGALAHADTIGEGSVIRPGDVQRMSAGSGVRHSEFNNSKTEPVHFLQIWIEPDRAGLTPSYEQITVSADEKRGALRRIGGRDIDGGGGVAIAQDVSLYAGLFDGDETARFDLEPGRAAWVHVARGRVEIAGQTLEAGDAVALRDEDGFDIRRAEDAEILVFDVVA